MPAKDMKTFVKNKNAGHGHDDTRAENAPGRKGSFDDLKATVPKTGIAPNSGQSRSNNQNANEQARTHPESRAPQDQQQLSRDSNGQRVFYDTEASSIDTTSTADGDKQLDTAGARVQQGRPTNGHQQPPQGLSSADEYEDGEEESSEESEEEPAADPLQPSAPGRKLSSKQHRLMTEMDHQKKKTRNSSALPYVKGDSYPDTTSGRPSVVDPTERPNHTDLQAKKMQAAPQLPLQQRQSGMRAPVGASSVQTQSLARPVAIDEHRNGSMIQRGLLARPAGLNEGPLEHEVNANFTFSKAKQPPLATRPPPKGQEPVTTEIVTSKPSISNNTAHRASVPTADDQSHQVDSHAQRASELATGNVALPERHHRSKPRQKSRTSAPVPQQIDQPAPEYEQISDAEDRALIKLPAGAHVEQHQQQLEEELDYDPAELFQMDYQDLKTQSFDVDPNAGNLKIPGDKQHDTLAKKLDTVGVLQQHDQMAFLASLPIDEWEEAGDWFVDRFSEILGKLKDARKEKRKAAKQFEDEIEKRHNAVSKKRKQTVDELSEMKESGGKVLQGTPKKAKTK